ncbi:MAG: hypothetical protein E7173_00905 [Firmicutes bacterium]|nr:hypothetical protein [Bacillota bacterium]
MKIYVDLVLFINFAFDFLLLLSVSILLRRKTSINKILFGAFLGSLSVLLLFIEINSIELFCFKIVISVLMILASFGFKSIKYFLKNIGYFYMSSIVLGGFLYFLNIEFSYKQEGLVFFHKGLSINFIFLIIFSPIIIYIYVKQGLRLKNNYSKYHKVKVKVGGKRIECVGYVDTGNKVVDPYFNRSIIFMNKHLELNGNFIMVPYQTIDKGGVIKCYKVDSVKIDNKEVGNNYLVSFINQKIGIDGVDCILPEIMEE